MYFSFIGNWTMSVIIIIGWECEAFKTAAWSLKLQKSLLPVLQSVQCKYFPVFWFLIWFPLSCLFELCKEDDIFSRQPVIDMGKFLQVITIFITINAVIRNITISIVKLSSWSPSSPSSPGPGETWYSSNRQTTHRLHQTPLSVHARGEKCVFF